MAFRSALRLNIDLRVRHQHDARLRPSVDSVPSAASLARLARSAVGQQQSRGGWRRRPADAQGPKLAPPCG